MSNVKLSADWSRNKEIGPRLIEQGTNKIFITPSEARVIKKFYWSRVRSERGLISLIRDQEGANDIIIQFTSERNSGLIGIKYLP